MPEARVCLVCGQAEFTDLYTAEDHLVSGESFLIRRCNGCSFAFTSEPPSEKEIGSYYLSDDYISHSDKKQTLADSLYHLARSYMLGRKQKLVTGVTHRDSGTLLDIGSGTGYFASFMKKKGWTVTAIELSEQARNFSITRVGIKALVPEKVKDISDASVDCITFWHVLEHLYDPAMWMREVKRILKDDGKCIIALPNLASADAKWFGDRWAALDVPRHLWHFSPETMIRFVGDHGFTCSKIRAMPLDVFYISALSYRDRGCRLYLLRGLLTGTLLTISSLFRKNSASSLIYIMSKQPL